MTNWVRDNKSRFDMIEDYIKADGLLARWINRFTGEDVCNKLLLQMGNIQYREAYPLQSLTPYKEALLNPAKKNTKTE